MGMFVVIGRRRRDNRLRLAGYRTSVVLTARLAVVGVSATVLALAATVSDASPADWDHRGLIADKKGTEL